MESRTKGTSRTDKIYGPVQLLDGKFAVDSESSLNRDEAAMTHAGLLFTEALAAAHNAPDVREDKIEAIRAQIANGTYEIDTRRLAEKLIRENPCLFDD